MAKIKITVQGEEVEITLTPEQLASIEAQKKPKKFEWKYPSKETYKLDVTYVRDSYSGTDIDSLEHGRYRITEEVAEQSLARNKRANRLEALAEQLGGLREFSHGQINCFVYKNGVWTHGYNTFDYSPATIYMTKECAKEICRMLNDGEFSLDGDQ